MNAPAHGSKLFIPGLNGLRAVSIIMVMCSHVNTYKLGFAVGRQWSFPLFDGPCGTNVFFVISGYLITTLLMKEKRATGEISIKHFYIRRILRIFPAYYFYVAVLFVLSLCSVLHITNASWLTTLTFTKYFSRSELATRHLWSLSVEEHFYLLWPLIFRRSKKYGFLFYVLIFAEVFRMFVIHWHVKAEWADSPAFFQRCDALAMGCIVALYFDRIKIFIDKLLNLSKYFVYLPFVALAFINLLVSPLGWPQWLHKLRFVIGDTYSTTANFAIAMIVVISITRQNAWCRFLNTPAMNFIGKLSYSLYLWQQLFIAGNIGFLSSVPFNLFFPFIPAIFSYYVIEKPFLRLKGRYEVIPTTTDAAKNNPQVKEIASG